MTDSVEEQIIDKQANATVLYAALGVNALLLFYSIYLSGSAVVSVQPDMALPTAMWEMTSGGGMLAHGFGILAMIAIGLLHSINRAVGKRSPLIEKIARILLKLPINLILLLFAGFIAFMGYGKYSTGTAGINLLGGGYMLDWITCATLLFLVFFVKKV